MRLRPVGEVVEPVADPKDRAKLRHLEPLDPIAAEAPLTTARPTSWPISDGREDPNQRCGAFSVPLESVSNGQQMGLAVEAGPVEEQQQRAAFRRLAVEELKGSPAWRTS